MNYELIKVNEILCNKVSIPEGKGYRLLLELYLQTIYADGLISDECIKEYIIKNKDGTD